MAASSDKSAGTDPSRWQFPAVLGVVGGGGGGHGDRGGGGSGGFV